MGSYSQILSAYVLLQNNGTRQLETPFSVSFTCNFSDLFTSYLQIYIYIYIYISWSLTLREESRLRVFENRILNRIFGTKRDENGEWRRLRNEDRAQDRVLERL